MLKRKAWDNEDAAPEARSKRTRKLKKLEPDYSPVVVIPNKTQRSASKPATALTSQKVQDEDLSGSPTPKTNGVLTPKKMNESGVTTPSRTRNADRSAKRKSARILAQEEIEDDWDGGGALAAAILEEQDEQNAIADDERDATEEDAGALTDTPSKRGRKRSQRTKETRSPTPEGDIEPEERYFFQNRAGPLQHSTNLFSSVKLLMHEEYFDQMRSMEDGQHLEKSYLAKLHTRSFAQWQFELSQGYSICLYGYGCKRKMVTMFAEWLHTYSKQSPTIVVANGFTPKLNIKHVLNTVGSAVAESGTTVKLTGQPQQMLDILLTHLKNYGQTKRLIVLVNSIDAPALRKGVVQSVLSRLAAHPSVDLLATADTPTFPLMWSSTLLDQFSYVFHDCTTLARYESELSVVDEVYNLLDRKGRRLGGGEGVGYVLKSLPPNARKLYQILLAEILTILEEGLVVTEHTVDGEEENRSKPSHTSTTDVGVEYRLLYQKAAEDFVCSSDMNFRFLLKEFHDHQMITSRRDASGTELLCVPLGKEEMQAVLEDLVVA
jgi:origin recognition complex subunit 2